MTSQSELTRTPLPADFGGRCLAGEAVFGAEVLMPSTTVLGLPKEGSYFYGSWRDEDGALLRALRGVNGDSSPFRFLFTSAPGRQLARDPQADAGLFSGPVTTTRDGDSVTFASVGAQPSNAFSWVHRPDGVDWSEGDYLSVSGRSLGPGLQWFNTFAGGACYSITAKYRSSGLFQGRRVEGFVGHEIHYFPAGMDWVRSVFGRGREICWQQVANEYEDGSTIQGTFAFGQDGWGFAMLHDEHGQFHCTTDVRVAARVRPSGYPESIRYSFLDQSWTWRIDPLGERAPVSPGSPLFGADGTCTRDGDTRKVRFGLGNSDWWTDGRGDAVTVG